MEDLTTDDPINVAGMGLLINEGGPKDFDPTELEQQIINGPKPQKKRTNISDEFAREMERLTKSFGGMGQSAPAPAPAPTPAAPKASSVAIDIDDLELPDKKDDVTVDIDNLIGNASEPEAAEPPLVQDPQLQALTREERKQAVIGEVFKDMKDQTVFSIEKEREEDEKARKIEQISFLRETLEEEGEDISRIPNVSSSASLREVDDMLKLLLLKNDRKRCCSFAEECILIGAHGVEWAFDGKRNYFGTRPDMTDWHKSVAVKLRRMRHDTSNVVQSIMQTYNLGSGTRILLELIPSMVLYSRMRKSQRTDSMVSDAEFSAGIEQMRSMEQKNPDS